MAAAGGDDEVNASQASRPTNIHKSLAAPVEGEAPSSTPVEMHNLAQQMVNEDNNAEKLQDVPAEAPEPAVPSSSTPAAPPAPDTTLPSSASQTQPPSLVRMETEALGPSSDAPIPTTIPTSATGPTLHISLMLTTGARHPYKIDEKYLRNRKVGGCKDTQGNFDPRELSGYKLKELIWTDWRSEWEPRPSSPSLIRLIILGRMLDDKNPLKDSPFSLTQPNVVHMTVKPAEFLDDDAEGAGKGSAKGGSLRARDGDESSAGCCRCVVQ